MPRKAKTPGPSAAGGYQPGANPGGGTLAPSAPTGLPYGEHQQLVQAQQQIPLPSGAPAPGPPAPPSGPTAAPAGQGGIAQALQAALHMNPPPAGGLLAPTARPDEPVTAGLPTGPGPGPEALGTPFGRPDDQVLMSLYHAYQVAPSEGLRSLIAQMEQLRGRSL